MDQPIKPLSYQSLQCVVQYINPIKRFLYAPSFPSLRNMNKVVPLTIGHLRLNDRSFRIDGVEYVGVTIPDSQFNREDLPNDVATFNDIGFFGGNRFHFVKHLQIGPSFDVLNLSEGLKFKIRELDMMNNDNEKINAIIPFLDKSSFPLKKLSINVEGPQDPLFEKEFMKTSKSLSLNMTGHEARSWKSRLVSLTNMELKLTGTSISSKDFIALARHWIQNSRKIGTKFTIMKKWNPDYPEMKKQHYEMKSLIKRELGTTDGYIRSNNVWTVKMNSSSELNIYEKRAYFNFVMEVMEIGSAKLENGDSINVDSS